MTPFFNERKHPTFAHVRHFHVWVTPLPRMLHLILEYELFKAEGGETCHKLVIFSIN